MKLKMTWAEAQEYASNLNLGEYSDWRVPTIDELKTLFDYAHGKPVVEMLPSVYWSSTTNADYPDVAWYVHFYNGVVYGQFKTSLNSVRYVRGGRFDPLGNLIILVTADGQERIIVNGDGTITDNMTGLIWEA